MNTLREIIENGFTIPRDQLPENLKEYSQYRDSLCTLDGVVLYGDRIVIPKHLRSDVLVSLHAAHHGTSSMRSRAESSVFWPGITNDIIGKSQKTRLC